jgi:hypothetical protein
MEQDTVVVSVAEPEKLQTLQALGEQVIYLMGFSFILGSLFTIFILVVLDFMRRHQLKKPHAH